MPAFVQTRGWVYNGSRGLCADTSEGRSIELRRNPFVNEFRAESTAKQFADRLQIVDPVAHRFDGHQDRHPE